MNKKLRGASLAFVVMVIPAGIIAMLWNQHLQYARQAHGLAMLQRIPAASAYGNGHDAVVYQGQKEGFQTTLTEWVSPTPIDAVSAQSAGSCVVTYRGHHPPRVAFIEIQGRTQHIWFDLLGQSVSNTRYPIVIGHHRYLYWSTQWNSKSPFNPQDTRQVYASSRVHIHFASGRPISIPQHRMQ